MVIPWASLPQHQCCRSSLCSLWSLHPLPHPALKVKGCEQFLWSINPMNYIYIAQAPVRTSYNTCKPTSPSWVWWFSFTRSTGNMSAINPIRNQIVSSYGPTDLSGGPTLKVTISCFATLVQRGPHQMRGHSKFDRALEPLERCEIDPPNGTQKLCTPVTTSVMKRWPINPKWQYLFWGV
jgi:hypothetical protein